jgi:uncharacterized protein (DUF4415 family)
VRLRAVKAAGRLKQIALIGADGIRDADKSIRDGEIAPVVTLGGDGLIVRTVDGSVVSIAPRPARDVSTHGAGECSSARSPPTWRAGNACRGRRISQWRRRVACFGRACQDNRKSTGDICMTRPPNRYRPTDALSVAEAVFKPAAPLAAAPVLAPKKAAVPVAKELVSIKLDSDLIAHFQEDGPGWQERINEALRRSAGL